MPRGRYVATLLIALAIAAALSITYLAWIEPGDKSPPPQYEISQKEGQTVATNLLTGRIEHESGSASEVLQVVFRSLPDGGTVLVRSGEYELDESVELSGNTILRGEGIQNTVFTSENKGMLVVKDRSCVTLSDFRLVGSTAIYITADQTDVSGLLVRNVEATVTKDIGGAFTLAPNGRTISEVSFIDCHAMDGEAYGFLNIGSRGDSLVRNITYTNCTAVDNGLSSRSHDWTVGFDLAEMTDVDRMLLVNCTANNNWESGFHFEDDIESRHIVFENCVANGNGRNKPDPLYGAGFVLNGDTVLRNCTADENAKANLLVFGNPRTVAVEGGDL